MDAEEVCASGMWDTTVSFLLVAFDWFLRIEISTLASEMKFQQCLELNDFVSFTSQFVFQSLCFLLKISFLQQFVFKKNLFLEGSRIFVLHVR